MKNKRIYPAPFSKNKKIRKNNLSSGYHLKKWCGVYLDYAATTPVDPKVTRAMLSYFSEKFGNATALYSLGQEAKKALEESREQVAGLIGAKPHEVIFTSSATESNNLALKGVAFAKATANQGKHIIVSSIEHPSVTESTKWLKTQGFKITKLSVDKYGFIDLNNLKKAIKKDTILVSIIHASNEIGTIQPIEKIGKIIKTKSEKLKTKIYFHTDAVQSFGKIPINVNRMKIDLLSASSHKMYGPKGAACLFVREGTKIEPLLHGGSQESGLRSSTVNVAGVVGFGAACKICRQQARKESRRLTKLRDKLIRGVLKKIPGSYLNGSLKNRLSNNINLRFDNVEGESIVIRLDLLGVAASTGSACSSGKLESSSVLSATGLKPGQSHGSLRLTLGRWTTAKEINYLLKILPGIIKRLRDISGKNIKS